MALKIISTTQYAEALQKTYESLEVPLYKLRKWFSTNQKIFFDCENTDKSTCIREVLKKPDYPFFRIYLVVKDVATDSYSFMDVNFRNLGSKETLENFRNRYHKQLETMTKLSLQGAGRQYIDCVGHGYEETMP